MIHCRRSSKTRNYADLCAIGWRGSKTKIGRGVIFLKGQKYNTRLKINESIERRRRVI